MVSMLALAVVAVVASAQTAVDRPSWGDKVRREREGGPFGMGMGIGAPTGFTAKVGIGDWMAMQVGVGGDLGRIGDFASTADYLIQFRPFDTGSAEYSICLLYTTDAADE